MDPETAAHIAALKRSRRFWALLCISSWLALVACISLSVYWFTRVRVLLEMERARAYLMMQRAAESEKKAAEAAEQKARQDR